MKSKAYILIVVSVLFMMLPSLIKAQEKVKVEVSGFVSTEAIYDSRKVVSAREGDVVLYPAPVVYDANGVDINEKGEFSLFSIHSRLRAKTSGAELWGGY